MPGQPEREGSAGRDTMGDGLEAFCDLPGTGMAEPWWAPMSCTSQPCAVSTQGRPPARSACGLRWRGASCADSVRLMPCVNQAWGMMREAQPGLCAAQSARNTVSRWAWSAHGDHEAQVGRVECTSSSISTWVISARVGGLRGAYETPLPLLGDHYSSNRREGSSDQSTAMKRSLSLCRRLATLARCEPPGLRHGPGSRRWRRRVPVCSSVRIGPKRFRCHRGVTAPWDRVSWEV